LGVRKVPVPTPAISIVADDTGVRKSPGLGMTTLSVSEIAWMVNAAFVKFLPLRSPVPVA
jgi:hypothetical protein